MITATQVQALTKKYQMDNFTILREYLQLVFLNHFYAQPTASNCFFKGGTALRLLFRSPRFSEDLDFSVLLTPKEIQALLTKVQASLMLELPGLELTKLHVGKETERYRLRYAGPETKYPITIKLDFHRVSKVEKTQVSALETDFPVVIFPLIAHLSLEIIFSEKLQALATRSKGRDVFDVWYLISLGQSLPQAVDRQKIVDKLKKKTTKQLKQDLGPFLPPSKRVVVESLKERLIKQIKNIKVQN